MKHRDQEALLILSKINYNSKKEYFVDTILELEDLRAATSKGTEKTLVILLKFFKWKYFSRYHLSYIKNGI